MTSSIKMTWERLHSKIKKLVHFMYKSKWTSIRDGEEISNNVKCEILSQEKSMRATFSCFSRQGCHSSWTRGRTFKKKNKNKHRGQKT